MYHQKWLRSSRLGILLSASIFFLGLIISESYNWWHGVQLLVNYTVGGIAIIAHGVSDSTLDHPSRFSEFLIEYKYEYQRDRLFLGTFGCPGPPHDVHRLSCLEAERLMFVARGPRFGESMTVFTTSMIYLSFPVSRFGMHQLKHYKPFWLSAALEKCNSNDSIKTECTEFLLRRRKLHQMILTT